MPNDVARLINQNNNIKNGDYIVGTSKSKYQVRSPQYLPLVNISGVENHGNLVGRWEHLDPSFILV